MKNEELRQLGRDNELGHSVTFSVDGKLIATGALGTSAPGRPPVRLWEVANGNEVREVGGHHAVKFSPDGLLMATGGAKLTLLQISDSMEQLLTTEPIYLIDEPSFRPQAFSPDGQFLAVSLGSVIQLWNVKSRKQEFPVMGHLNGVTKLAVTRDGRTLASASHDETVRQWDVLSGKELARIKGICASFSADGKTAAIWDKNKPLQVWDIATQKRLGPNEGTKGHCLSPDGKLIADHMQLIEVETGKILKRLGDSKTHIDDPAAFSPDGKLLALVFDDGVSLLDLENGIIRELYNLRVKRADFLPQVAFSQDGKLVATASAGGKISGKISIWDPKTGKLNKQWAGGFLGPPGGAICSIALSDDSLLVATGDRDGTIHLWESTTGRELSRVKGHSDRVQALVFSPDGTMLFSGSQDTTILAWDVNHLKKRGVN